MPTSASTCEEAFMECCSFVKHAWSWVGAGETKFTIAIIMKCEGPNLAPINWNSIPMLKCKNCYEEFPIYV